MHLMGKWQLKIFLYLQDILEQLIVEQQEIIKIKTRFVSIIRAVLIFGGENCQRVMTLPNGTYSENYDQRKIDGMWGTNDNICQAGGDFYLIFPFVYKGQIYQVAEVLTKFE